MIEIKGLNRQRFNFLVKHGWFLLLCLKKPPLSSFFSSEEVSQYSFMDLHKVLLAIEISIWINLFSVLFLFKRIYWKTIIWYHLMVSFIDWVKNLFFLIEYRNIDEILWMIDLYIVIDICIVIAKQLSNWNWWAEFKFQLILLHSLLHKCPLHGT